MNSFLVKLVLLFFVLSWASYAQDDKVDYSQAYDICSPVSHQLTKEKCHYGRAYEAYYTQCMHQQGYAEENTEALEDSQFATLYLKSYRYCASIAEQYTKHYCVYGKLYNAYYNKCMAKYGFNQYGEIMTETEQKNYQQNQQKERDSHFEFNF